MSVDQVIRQSRDLVAEDRRAENLALLRDAVSEFPEEAEIAHQAAVAHHGEDDAEAERLERRAVELDPQDPILLMRAASFMLDLGHTDEAFEWGRRSRDHADEDFPLLFDLVHLLGRIALVREQYEQALEPLQIAFDNQPESLGHGRLLALALEHLERPQEALEVVEEAIGHCPEDHELEEQRIWLRLILFGPETLPPGATIEYPTTD